MPRKIPVMYRAVSGDKGEIIIITSIDGNVSSFRTINKCGMEILATVPKEARQTISSIRMYSGTELKAVKRLLLESTEKLNETRAKIDDLNIELSVVKAKKPELESSIKSIEKFIDERRF